VSGAAAAVVVVVVDMALDGVDSIVLCVPKVVTFAVEVAVVMEGWVEVVEIEALADTTEMDCKEGVVLRPLFAGVGRVSSSLPKYSKGTHTAQNSQNQNNQMKTVRISVEVKKNKVC
jgi:hypothetical protein